MIPLIILFAGILNLIMGVIVLLGSNEKNGKRSFIFLSGMTFFWALSNFFMYSTSYAVFDRLAYAFGAMVITSLLAWVYSYSSESKRKKIIASGIYVMGIAFALLPLLSNLIVYDIVKDPLAGFNEQDGPLFYVYVLYFLATFVGIFIHLFRLHRKSEGDKKGQVRLFLTGFSLYAGISIFCSFILPLFNYQGLIDIDVPTSIIFIAFTTYAIVEYKWMHLKVITTELLAIFIVGASLFELFLAETIGQRIYKSIMFVIFTTLSILLVRSVINETKRKEQLQRMSDSLAFANDKLRVNNTKLEKIDAIKTDFINIASHQLHKVPTPIKGYLSLLLEGSYGKLSAEQRRVLENINFANDRQINLVDDLLNVSRMESGKVQLDFEKEHLETICQEVCDALSPVAKGKGLKFSYVNPKKALPKLIIDKRKIFEAIFNFVDNAVKYTPKGKVDLQVKLDARSRYEKQAGDDEQKEALTGPVVRVMITDTGVGIAPENIPDLFAKFSRKDTANLNIEGTGLGLYVVKLMIEAHGGRAWAESPGEGKGSTFIIEIPVEQPKNIVAKE